jgi:hypothetical protein
MPLYTFLSGFYCRSRGGEACERHGVHERDAIGKVCRVTIDARKEDA